MIYMKATDLYEKILKSNLINIEGSITFDYDNLSIKVKEKSAVGNLFQEWFGNWLKKHNIGFRLNPNTQESPDFFLHETSNETDLLEIKGFVFKWLWLEIVISPCSVDVYCAISLEWNFFVSKIFPSLSVTKR